MSKPVAKSRLHKRLNDSQHKEFAPDPRTDLEATCRIGKVWDRDVLEMETPTTEVKSYLDSFPGLILAEVTLSGGSKYILPFEETPDQIYSTYGNATLLEGRLGRIRYRNKDIRTGVITPIRLSSVELISVTRSSEVADIGSVWGLP